MRAVHVYRTYFPDPPGGLQEAIRQICLGTSSYGGVENIIYALSPTPEPRSIRRPEGEVIREKSLASPASCDLGGPRAVATFASLVRRCEVVHYHFPWPFADLLSEWVRPKCGQMMTYHSDIVRQRWLGAMYSPLMWRMLKRMKVIVATSRNYANTSTVLSHPEIRDKVRVVPLGIDESSYPAAGDHGVFDRLMLTDGEPFFLFIGVLRYYKGVHTLIRAAKSIGAKVVIAGTGPEGGRLKALTETLELNNVVFAGFVSDAEKVALLKACRALVLPSHLRSEAFGMVLIEAAMFGKPMISCEIGTGTSFANAHEETGFVVAPEHPNALRDAMSALLRDERLAGAMGIAARRRYEALFSGAALGRAYTAIYDELL